MRTVFSREDIPDSHKIAVYDALCRYLEKTVDAYYTDRTPTDPRYDSGIEAPSETRVIGLDVDSDGYLEVTVALEGWVDPQAFSLDLPGLTRDAHTGDSAGVQIDGD